MTRLVVVPANIQAEWPVGIEQGARYALTAPDGARAVFNDRNDVDFVGWLTAPPSGFDLPEIRESSDLIVEGDGGVHGNFYLGRRPWTLEGMIDSTPDIARDVMPDTGDVMDDGQVTDKRIHRLKRASRARRADATLTWTSYHGAAVMLRARQQGLRITERLPKKFLLSMVSAEPRIFGQVVKTASAPYTASVIADNDGMEPSPPIITLRGPWSDPVITNAQTGEALRLTAAGGITMVSGDTLVIDAAAKTILLNGVNHYGALAFPTSAWWDVQPGTNAISSTGGASGASLQVDWRDAWS